MSEKRDHLAKMYEDTTLGVTKSLTNWTDFLTVVGNLYKYPYHEQLMIYAQKPKATACAEFGLWNDTMNRFVKKGTSGIALIDPSTDKGQIKYVFDVADTGGKVNARKPYLWEMKEHHEKPILDMLISKYEVKGNDIHSVIDKIANKLATEYYNDSAYSISQMVEDSFLEELDDYNIEVTFREAVSVSISYTLMKRMGIDVTDHLEHEDFLPIFDFNTPATISLLGTAVSEQTEQVFREIAKTILKEERNLQYEQSNLQDRGRISNPEHSDARARELHTGQIREDEKSTSNGTPQATVQPPITEREVIPSSSGDRQDSGQSHGTVNERPREETTITEQDDPSNGMGSTSEQPTSSSRGNDFNGVNIQLTPRPTLDDIIIDEETQPQQITLFPTEEQQIKTIADRQSAKAQSQSAISISEEEISNKLKHGTGFVDGKLRVYDLYQTDLSPKEIANRIKSEYGHGGGTHYYLDGRSGFVSSEPSKGLIFTVSGIDDKYKLSWTEVEKRIRSLVTTDSYLANDEKTRYEEQQLTKVGLVEEITQEDIDNAILKWNGDAESKARVLSFMREHGRERGTAQWLQNEFGDNLPSFVIEKGILSESIPWTKIQRQLGKFIAEDKFLITDSDKRYTLEETSDAFDEPFAIRDNLVSDDTLDRYHDVEGHIQTFETEEEAQAIADKLNALSEHQPPKLIFFEDFQDVDIDYSKYNDRDVIGYNIDGVKYSVGKSGSITYTTQETAITPMGDVLGDSMTPEVYEQFKAWKESLSAPQEELVEPVQEIKGNNFRITDSALGHGTKSEKYKANMQAIRTLQALETENRPATEEEQIILSQYVGWGGLPEVFEESHVGYLELKARLTDEEYSAARASVLNAHYTSPTIINAIYDAVENMGFTTGNILEPSCGVGNFFGMLPDSMSGSNLYGVELDSITGRIAKQLYPNANIAIKGFEKTDYPDNFFDLSIGNVPFGNYSLNEKRYAGNGFKVHDHFFAKSLDKIRPGGVVAFVTSKGTLDKENPQVRKYLAQRAELLGAIRLPNNAFKANAGTEVTSDIIFFQKRDTPIDIVPDWVHLDYTENDVPVNSYFTENPEMILGEMVMQTGQFGMESACIPLDGADLSEQLRTAVKNIVGVIHEVEFSEVDNVKDSSIPADPSVKNYSYTLVDGEVYYRENSRMTKPEVGATALERIKGMVAIRECVNDLIRYQLEEYSDDTIKQAQNALNSLYDNFTAKYGLINSRGNALAFNGDNSYYLLASLEDVDEDGNLKAKADMFTKRTIKPSVKVTSVDTPSEALAVSLSEKAKIDMDFMSKLTGKTELEIFDSLKGVIFLNPMHGFGNTTAEKYVTADEYLSGNVREKLEWAKRSAKLSPDEYNVNVEALEKAQPKDLDASEIEVRLGATWIDKDYIEEFMYETFETPYWSRSESGIKVKFANFTNEWSIRNKNQTGYNDVASNTTYGTSRANAYRILEDTLNLRDIRIYDTVEDVDGKEKRVLNRNETTLAQQKQQLIKDKFKDWIWNEPTRRQDLVHKYNEKFNSTKPREYNGSHITFGGINPEIKLREHQINAIAHILYGNNVLLAHEVGAGKSFEMVAGAMESKRLGLCNKPLIAVPNHLTEQMASEFLRLYPAANILVATKKDFETKNRKKFCARIATGEYDAIIMGHSQFERIPVSLERQERLLNEQIDEIINGISEVKASGGEKFTIKQLERTKKGLEQRLEKLQALERKDDVINFEQLGVDKLIVDEAHAYKNGFVFTKMRNVAGLGSSESQRSADMFMKCRYLDEITGGKGVVFATGTPLSNSMVEMFILQRYLQYDTLRQNNLLHFDAWASTFGETQTTLEINPQGSGYRARTRFSKFFNLPELINMFKEVADIKTAEELNLPTPKIIYETVSAAPTDLQKEIVQDLSKRATAVQNNQVDPSIDNMLTITNDGRKLGLDQRVYNPLLPDDPNSKVNTCISKVYEIWQDTKEERLTQLLFCDLSTPKPKPKDLQKVAKTENTGVNGAEVNALQYGVSVDEEVTIIEKEQPFSVYHDIKDKLIDLGVPEYEIAFIHDAKTEVQKKELYNKVRNGDVRVMLGSTSKCGSGMNVQDRLIALHDLDAPWRPGDLRQRSGRIERQGNMNEEANIYRYVTESTFDSYIWQTLENKQKFISQIMTSKSPVRSCDDLDESSLSFAEIKALCAGNPKIKLKMDLDIDVAKLKLLKASHQSTKYMLEDKILKYFPEKIKASEGYIVAFEKDLVTLSNHTPMEDAFSPMVIKGDTLIDKDNAGAAILASIKEVKSKEPVEIGTYRGFTMNLHYDSFYNEHKLTLKGAMSHTATLGSDLRGNLTRIDNALNMMPTRLKSVQEQLANLKNQKANAEVEVLKPFPQEQELIDKTRHLAELDIELNLANGSENNIEENEPTSTEVVAKSSRPSVLDNLKSIQKQQTEPKPKKERQEER